MTRLATSNLRAAILSVVLLGFSTVGTAQTGSLQSPRPKTQAQSPDSKPAARPTAAEPSTAVPAPAYLDQVIDAAEYRVGPGDMILVNIWSDRPEQYEVKITPEAMLIIPGVGEMSARNMTLAELKTAAIARLREFYPRNPITITLGDVRRFRVSVTGAVEKPGLHVVTANTRASEVLDLAGLMDDAARRQVRLERGDTTINVDLAAFERLGIRSANPYLSEGDVLVVPPVDNRWGNVRVDGGVAIPGVFGYSPGDLVGDLIDLAYGLTANADTTKIELWRFAAGENQSRRYDWPPATTYSQWRRFALRPDDRLLIRTIEDYRPKRGVRVTGEVVHPGYYVVLGEGMSLRELIDSAGGFTEQADLAHALIIRTDQPQWVEETRTRLQLVPPELRSQSESDVLVSDALSVRGRVAADFVRLFVAKDTTYDVPLFDRDEVVIPRLTESINVIGRVVQPGMVPVMATGDLEYYLARAGGYSWQADRGGTFLVKGATGAAIKKKHVKEISAGDTIVVPTKRGRKWWQGFRETLTVATSLATLYLVFDQVSK
jgi:protein involved in polysaccharide export with SLBB domain